MAIDKIAKISLAVSFVEHLLFIGIVVVAISVPAAKYIPLIEVNLMNTLALNDLMSSAPSSGGPNNEPVKNSVAPNVAIPDKLLPPSEVGTAQEGSLAASLDAAGSGVAENIKYSGGKVAGFTFTGAGIVTARPDNVYIQFMVKSGPCPTTRGAEIQSTQKVSFLTYNLGRLFKIKKESFKSYGFQPEVLQQTVRQAKSLKRRDDDGKAIDQMQMKYNITKYVVVNDLGSKKFVDICEILDKAIDYGATAIADIPKLDNSVSDQVSLGVGDTQTKAVKGATKLKFNTDTKNPANQLINYHFNQATLEKVIKSAKDQAYKEAKEKVDKIKALLKFKEKDMDISFKEAVDIKSNEDGDISVMALVTTTLARTDPAAAMLQKAVLAAQEGAVTTDR